MTKSALLLSLILAATAAVAQQGTPPDPMAGQSSSSTTPGANPTDTPQAKPNQSPSAKPEPARNATTQPTEAAPTPGTQPNAQTPATQPASNGQQPSTAPAKDNSTPNPPQKPQSDTADFTARVEVTPPVSGSPETKIIDASAVGKHTGVTGAPDPLFDVPPLPKGKPTLIGGTAVKVDRIRSRVVVEPFGAKKKMPISIDERTHIYRNGIETTILGIKKGDRVYFDTMLDGAKVFAKNVRVISETGGAEVRGQITAYDPGRGIIQLQDALSSRPVSFRINSATKVRMQGGNASTSDLAKGALVDVLFAPDKSNRGIATEVTLLARPGASYTFAGVITNVNVRDGIVSVENGTDGKVYDIEFDPRSRSERNGLHIGNSVNIRATFDGENYKATNVTVTEAKAQSKARPQDKKQKDDEDQQ